MSLIKDNPFLKDVLWGMYQENCVQGRHHESQRATATNLTLVVSGALLGLITLDKAITPTDAFLGAVLMLFGLFGAGFSIKHYERHQQHMERARNKQAMQSMRGASPKSCLSLVGGP